MKNSKKQKKYNYNTVAVHGKSSFDPLTGAVSTPIYQSATFRHPKLYESTGYDYSRLQNPTREAAENAISLLENGKEALAFSSGMAAVSTVIKLFKSGDSIIVSDDLYGGIYRIFESIYSVYGIKAIYTDTTSIQNIENAYSPSVKAIFLESPTNPTMKISNIRKISEFSKEKNILTIVDNTFLTSYFQKPLDLGADIVIYSGTKYLAGHNDTLAGFIVSSNDDIIENLRLIQKSEGAVLSPFDSWLVLRGLKTLPLRMDRINSNTQKIAEFLNNHSAIKKIYYPGLPSHKGHELLKTQSTGFGGIISFEVESAAKVEKILENVELIMFAESLGGTETLITYPMVQTHNAIPEEIRNKIGVNDRLLRLSVGIENVDDLVDDLDFALSI
ncbi:MAG: PLP-dependent transferase [Clostridiales bacterium]|nr:PLP-dependent transferase [Clostridiales bacterium]